MCRWKDDFERKYFCFLFIGSWNIEIKEVEIIKVHAMPDTFNFGKNPIKIECIRFYGFIERKKFSNYS